MSNIKYFLTLIFTIFISQKNCVKANCEIENEADLPNPRIVILGGTGAGKPNLAKKLLGPENNPQSGCDCFKDWTQTLDSCAQGGKYLGKEEMNVTIIDTPNFENENIDVVVDFLKNELKYAHVFVISFENPICQAQLVIDDKVKFGLQMFGKIFGNQFWKHVILQVSNWKYSDDFVNCREGLNPQKTESMWSNKIRDILKSASNIPDEAPLNAVFIDKAYVEANVNEKAKFEENTKSLWDFADSLGKFDFKDIELALNEIKNLEDSKETIQGDLNITATKLEEEEQKSQTLNEEKVVLETKLNEEKGKSEGLETELSEEKQKNQNLNQENTNLVREKAELVQEKVELETKLNNEKAELETRLNNEKENLETKLNGEKAELETKLNNEKAKLETKLNNEKANLVQEKADLELRLNNITAQLKNCTFELEDKNWNKTGIIGTMKAGLKDPTVIIAGSVAFIIGVLVGCVKFWCCKKVCKSKAVEPQGYRGDNQFDPVIELNESPYARQSPRVTNTTNDASRPFLNNTMEEHSKYNVRDDNMYS